jgi:hypothetical protein
MPALPRTTIVVAARGPGPETQTRDQRSASAQRIFQKGLPSLRRQILAMHHVFRDRRLGDLKAKHQKLAVDPRCAPQRVFPAHPPDQIPQAAIDLWPPCPISGFSSARTL